MMILYEKAKALAQETVSRLSADGTDDLALFENETIEIEKGWIFFYNTRSFIEDGDSIAALAGNGPISVTKDGMVHNLPSAIPWEIAVKAS
ncbi:YrhB domain-containing protein [Mesorhizobium muleiense]|jgi:hypothetical protein|uniref:YrhB domain-containing protein n=1 Tax=Mesorhizobium muleiense TaxID=1004279 RepID=UPI001F315013|nr:YrhB domain-containing protein [Mesorhizobium muleiense]MCF6112625.1 YrhB family protein [Mesorhizobium muleiense]